MGWGERMVTMTAVVVVPLAAGAATLLACPRARKGGRREEAQREAQKEACVEARETATATAMVKVMAMAMVEDSWAATMAMEAERRVVVRQEALAVTAGEAAEENSAALW